jgi:predicted RNase H-like HicB family nuclease
MRYLALLDGAPGAYGIFIPDCPGCTAMGETESVALANAIEALAEWVEDCAEPPPARTLAELRMDKDVAQTLEEGAAFLFVPLIRETATPVRANISLSAGVLEAIDDAAQTLGITRSAFIASAALEKIGKTY